MNEPSHPDLIQQPCANDEFRALLNEALVKDETAQ